MVSKQHIGTSSINAVPGNFSKNRRGPQMRYTSNGLIVSNTEYLQTINSSTSTAAPNWGSLNPIYFPWLGGVANSFNHYRYKKLIINYVSYAPTTQSGFFSMGALYDFSDYQYYYSVPSAQTLNNVMASSASCMGPYYGSNLRTVSSGIEVSDISLEFDIGRIHARTPYNLVGNFGSNFGENNQVCSAYFCAIGSPSNLGGSCGAISVSYEIELLHPVASVLNSGTGFRLSAWPDPTAPPPVPDTVPKPDTKMLIEDTCDEDHNLAAD